MDQTALLALLGLGDMGRLFGAGRAGPSVSRRQQVPVLSDAQPLHRQLDPYYLQREDQNIYNAPLEWMSPEQPWGRPDGPADPQFDLPNIARLMQQLQGRG